ncbi:hypothetical protein AVEN_209322-1 [Araneus ventricosus]|uniref:ATP-dependent DNA helicase n=1 Tax=Araneus ventricosus TaxID=182803 RepID=A0A4Y2CDX2_ARAVE|nr:hypothetical protein AVEN_209322-1 [Araneus ventricosus]
MVRRLSYELGNLSFVMSAQSQTKRLSKLLIEVWAIFEMTMRGVVFLLSGDFRQTLPVISRATPEDKINAFLKTLELWQYVQRKTLTTKMRSFILSNIPPESFAKQSSNLGDEKFPTKFVSDLISIQSDF